MGSVPLTLFEFPGPACSGTALMQSLFQGEWEVSGGRKPNSVTYKHTHRPHTEAVGESAEMGRNGGTESGQVTVGQLAAGTVPANSDLMSYLSCAPCRVLTSTHPLEKGSGPSQHTHPYISNTTLRTKFHISSNLA